MNTLKREDIGYILFGALMVVVSTAILGVAAPAFWIVPFAMTAGATAIVLITIEFVDKAALPKRNEFIGALVLVCWVLGGCLTAIAIVLWAWGARTWWTMTKLIRR